MFASGGRYGVRDDTLQALYDGQTPGQISRQRGVSLATTLQYLNQMVGEGRLRRSDILFSSPREVRQAIADVKDRTTDTVDPADYRVVQLYGNAAHALGDMYDDLCEVEKVLHNFVRVYLQVNLGGNEAGWWRKGTPEAIRKSRQTRREEDPEPAAEPYCYTDLIDLGRMIEHNWSFGPPASLSSSLWVLSSSLERPGLVWMVRYAGRDSQAEAARQMRSTTRWRSALTTGATGRPCWNSA